VDSDAEALPFHRLHGFVQVLLDCTHAYIYLTGAAALLGEAHGAPEGKLRVVPSRFDVGLEFLPLALVHLFEGHLLPPGLDFAQLNDDGDYYVDEESAEGEGFDDEASVYDLSGDEGLESFILTSPGKVTEELKP